FLSTFGQSEVTRTAQTFRCTGQRTRSPRTNGEGTEHKPGWRIVPLRHSVRSSTRDHNWRRLRLSASSCQATPPINNPSTKCPRNNRINSKRAGYAATPFKTVQDQGGYSGPELRSMGISRINTCFAFFSRGGRYVL